MPGVSLLLLFLPALLRADADELDFLYDGEAHTLQDTADTDESESSATGVSASGTPNSSPAFTEAISRTSVSEAASAPLSGTPQPTPEGPVPSATRSPTPTPSPSAAIIFVIANDQFESDVDVTPYAGRYVKILNLNQIGGYKFDFGDGNQIKSVTINVTVGIPKTYAVSSGSFDFGELGSVVNLTIVKSASVGQGEVWVPHVKDSFTGKVDELHLQVEGLIPVYSEDVDLGIQFLALEPPFKMAKNEFQFLEAKLTRGVRYGSLGIFNIFDSGQADVDVKEVVIAAGESDSTVTLTIGDKEVNVDAGTADGDKGTIAAKETVVVETSRDVTLDLTSKAEQVGVKLVYTGNDGTISLGSEISSTAKVEITVTGGAATVSAPEATIPVALGGNGVVKLEVTATIPPDGPLTVSSQVAADGPLEFRVPNNVGYTFFPGGINLTGNAPSFRVVPVGASARLLVDERYVPAEALYVWVHPGTAGHLYRVSTNDTRIDEGGSLEYLWGCTLANAKQVAIGYVLGDYVDRAIITFGTGQTADELLIPAIQYVQVRSSTTEQRSQLIAVGEAATFKDAAAWVAGAKAVPAVSGYGFQTRVNGQTIEVWYDEGGDDGPTSPDEDNDGFPIGAIVGIVVGALVVIAIIAFLVIKVVKGGGGGSGGSSDSVSSSSDFEDSSDEDSSI